MKSFKLLDGYNLATSTDGYTFVTPWVDLHSSRYFSAIAVFTGAAIANGTLKLQMSNDEQADIFDGYGRRYPKSATSSVTDPDDVIDVPASLTGTVTQSISAVGKYVYQQYMFPGRWVRFRFDKTGSPAGATICNIFFHFKTQ